MFSLLSNGRKKMSDIFYVLVQMKVENCKSCRSTTVFKTHTRLGFF